MAPQKGRGNSAAGIALLLATLALALFIAGMGDGIHLFQDQFGDYQVVVSVDAGGGLPFALLLSALLIGATWLCGSYIISSLTGTELRGVLKRDALTFLPLAILLIVALRYIPGAASFSSALFLASSTLARGLLLTALLLVAWLKYDLYKDLKPAENGEGRKPVISDRAAGWIVFLIFVVFFALAIPPFSAEWPFGGDEPHYLMVTHSVLEDGDIYFGDDYDAGAYRQFTQWQRLTPQYLRKTRDNQIAPIHRIGVPVLAVPFYALAGKLGAVLMIGLMAALSAANIYWLVIKIVPHRLAALAATAWVTLSVPLLPLSFLFYTEVPLSCFTLLALNMIFRRGDEAPRWPWLIPLVIWILPWLHQRGFMTAVALSLLLAFRLRKRLPVLIWVGSLCLVLALATPAWNWHLYGEFSLLAEMGGAQHKDVSLWNIIPGFAGLLFDRNFGLLLNNPAVVPALIGLVPLWRRRRDAVVGLILVAGFTIGPGLAYHMWWGGGSVAARYAAPVIALAALPMAALLCEKRWKKWRFASVFLGAISMAIAASMLLHSDLLTNSRTATSRILTAVSAGHFDAVEWWPSWFDPSGQFWGGVALLLVAVTITAGIVLLSGRIVRSIIGGGPAAKPVSAVVGMAAFLACLCLYGWAAEALTPGEPNGRQPHSRDRDLLYLQRYRHGDFAMIDQGGSLRPDSLPARGFSAQRLFSGWALERDEKVPGGRSFRLPAGENKISLRPATPLWAGSYELRIGLRAANDPTDLRITLFDISDVSNDFKAQLTQNAVRIDTKFHEVCVPIELPHNSLGIDIEFDSGNEIRFSYATLQTLALESMGDWPLPAELFDKAAIQFNEYALYTDPRAIYEPEKRWFWTRGDSEAELTVVSRRQFSALRISLVGHPPVRAVVSADGVEEAVTFEKDRRNVSFEIPVNPREFGGYSIATLRIRCFGAFVPARMVEGSSDERELGVHARITLIRNR